MKKIVVLDDDEVILDLLGTLLADAGYEAVVASEPDALPSHTSADLVVTDLIPLTAYQRESALRWVSSLRSRFSGAPVFVLTGHGEAVTEVDRLGADAVLMKPFDVDGLLAKIAEVLAYRGDHIRNTP